jgi:hypothetical protein
MYKENKIRRQNNRIWKRYMQVMFSFSELLQKSLGDVHTFLGVSGRLLSALKGHFSAVYLVLDSRFQLKLFPFHVKQILTIILEVGITRLPPKRDSFLIQMTARGCTKRQLTSRIQT